MSQKKIEKRTWINFEMGFLSVSAAMGRVTEIKYQKDPYPEETPEIQEPILEEIKNDLIRYFDGINVDFKKYNLSFEGLTSFEIAVYRTTQTIPYGEWRSYKWIAERVGIPRAYKAVGNALRKNRFLIVVPCHRVWKNDGTLGGFGIGTTLKEYLCRIEGIIH